VVSPDLITGGKMTISFQGQVEVVTGGGGGIGRVQALKLARLGASEGGEL
jgi:hypothetical protein